MRYYLDQQGHGMSVFRGSPGGLFRSLKRAVMPMVKSGAKALGTSALNTGTNVLKNVVAGKDLEQAIKARGKEALTDAKDKAINRLQTFAQTGSGKRTKKRPTSQTKKRRTPAKKRKAATSTIRINQTKKNN